MVRLGLMIESVEKFMPQQMVFKPQKQFRSVSLLTKFVEGCQYATERGRADVAKSESKSNSEDRSYMSAFEVKSEGSRRGRRYCNLLDGSEDNDSAKDFKRGDQLGKGSKSRKMMSLIPLKSEKRKP